MKICTSACFPPSVRHLTMKLAAALAVAAVALTAGVAAEKSGSREEKKGLRVLAAPDRDHRVSMQRAADKRPLEMENVTFLGVETSPVSATLSAQLGLDAGTGLVVNHLVPKSPAADVLKPHDILLKLDDQILIEVRQLSVLIRNHKEGDEVTLTYMRAGQKGTAKVKLGRHEVPKFSELGGPGKSPFDLAPRFPGPRFEHRSPDVLDNRQDVDRLLGLIQRAPGAPDGPPGYVPPSVRMRIDHDAAPGFRAMAVHTGNSNLVFSDHEGSLELTLKDGAKTLVAKNAAGDQLFSGPVATPAERAALPAEIRVRLEKLEAMRDVTFHTDRDFKGAEHKIIRPRGINIPLFPPPAPNRPRPVF